MSGVLRGAVFFQNGGLNPWDVDREVDVGTGAGAHAKFVGTNQAAGLSHRVVAGDGFHGAVKIVLDCFGDEFLRIAVNRTGIHAGFGFAGKAASEFGNQLRTAQI